MSWSQVGLADPCSADSTYMSQIQTQLREAGTATGTARVKLSRYETGVALWQGEARDAFVQSVSDLLDDLREMETSYNSAAAALRDYATSLVHLEDDSRYTSGKAVEAQNNRDYSIRLINNLDSSLPNYESERSRLDADRSYWQKRLQSHLDSHSRIVADADRLASRCKDALWEAQKVGIGNRNILGRGRDQAVIIGEEIEDAFDELAPIIAVVGIAAFIFTPVGLAGFMVAALKAASAVNTAGKWVRAATGDRDVDAEMLIDLGVTVLFGTDSKVLRKVPYAKRGIVGTISEQKYYTALNKGRATIASGDWELRDLYGPITTMRKYEPFITANEQIDFFRDTVTIVASPWTHSDGWDGWRDTQISGLRPLGPAFTSYRMEVDL